MNDKQPWRFTCKTCEGHKLTVTHVWSILAGPDSESWQEWGPLEADHLWHYDFKEKVEKEEDDDNEAGEVERGDFGEFAEDDSDSEPEEYESFEPEGDPESDEFYVNCAGCDREIELGWSEPDRGGRIFPVDCSDFIPGECWPGSQVSGFLAAETLTPNGKRQVMINDQTGVARTYLISIVHGKLLQERDIFTWIHKEPVKEAVPHGL